MYDKALDWAKKRYPQEHRFMMRLWGASWRISRPISVAAILALSIPGIAIGFLVGRFIGTTNITENIQMPPTGPAGKTEGQTASRKWEPLSDQEALALHEAWRNFPPQHFGVFCAIPACADLADSIYNVATGLHWKTSYQSMYLTDDTGIHPGIQIWSWPQAGQSEMRDKIANAIEQATNGRLLISSHENTWNGAPLPNAQMPADFGLQINLVIGRLQ